MNRKLIAFLWLVALVGFCGYAAAATGGAGKAVAQSLAGKIDQHASLAPKTRAFVKRQLLPTIGNPVVAKAVGGQNAKGMTLAEIQATDKKWIDAEEEMPIQAAVRKNECAKELFALVAKNPAVLEVFVMDNQGAVVCENSLTSDYWQGDEAKWQKSFNGGKGGVDAGKVKFDKSANTNLQQVSLPILDGAGKVIGAITFGLKTDLL